MGAKPHRKFFEMKKELPAVQNAYDLCKEFLPRVSRFPKDHKFTLGDRIVGNCLSILELAEPVSSSGRTAKPDLLP